MTAKKALSYADAGVNIDAGNALVEAIKPAVASTRRSGSDTQIGGFGGLFDLKAAGYSDPILVAANDGVGTKLKLAIEAQRHNTIGIDLVAMCANDLVVQGAEPLFFLDYFATGKLNIDQGRSIVEGIAEGCRQAGAALIGGETAEMPGLYQSGDYDLAGFCVGACERGKLLPSGDIKAGDVVLGLASTGLHSNGYSLVRKIVEMGDCTLGDRAPFDHGHLLVDLLLEPTRIYVKSLLHAIKHSNGIKALAHITGGGLPENLPRVLPEEVGVRIDLSALQPHPVFGWLQGSGDIAVEEMLRTFNCGVGMVVIADSSQAKALCQLLTDCGETVTQIGEIETGISRSVRFEGKLEFRI